MKISDIADVRGCLSNNHSPFLLVNRVDIWPSFSQGYIKCRHLWTSAKKCSFLPNQKEVCEETTFVTLAPSHPLPSFLLGMLSRDTWEWVVGGSGCHFLTLRRGVANTRGGMNDRGQEFKEPDPSLHCWLSKAKSDYFLRDYLLKEKLSNILLLAAEHTQIDTMWIYL